MLWWKRFRIWRKTEHLLYCVKVSEFIYKALESSWEETADFWSNSNYYVGTEPLSDLLLAFVGAYFSPMDST